MSAWSSLVKGLTKIFGKGGSAASSKVAGEAVQAAGATILTWGNAFKVAIAGGFTWLFLNGGASNVVASTLGISQNAAQILIIFGFVVLMIIITRFIVNYVRSKLDLKQEYFDTPIVQNTRNHYWDECERRWKRRYD